MTANTTILADLENEQDVIGVMLRDEQACASMAYLRPEHFWEPVHQRIVAAMADIRERGQTVSLGAIKTALRGDTGLIELDKVSPNGDYLANLWSKFCAASYAEQVGPVIFDDWTRREAVAIAQNAVSLATGDNPRPAVDVLAYMRNSVETLSNDAAASDSEFLDAPTVAVSVLANIAEAMRSGKTRGKRTGLRCVDFRLGGLQPGALVVIGGRPSMGKTALARAIAHGAAVHNPKDRVLFLGLEMSPEEMLQRELSAITHEMGDGVEFRDMGRSDLHPHQMAQAQKALDQVPGNLILRDCGNISIDDVRRSIWSQKRKCKKGEALTCVVIDYLQLMRRPDARGRNDAAIIGEITMALKQIARQAKTCIVLLSQLSRQVETRDDKRPMLSDLRESGSIEQDADAVLFPYREAYYLERTKPSRGKEPEHDMEVMRLQRVMEVIAAKVRGGAVGTDKQVYYAEYDHISDEVRA